MDFEKAPISAASTVFESVTSIGCHFHLSQSIWRKVQEVGLATKYGDIPFALNIRKLSALAFLPADEIPSAFLEVAELLSNEEPNTKLLLKYFEETYVLGRIRIRKGKVMNSRTQPLFPPSFWSVHQCIEHGLPRTQNSIEAWHRRWNTLVDSQRSTYRLIEEAIEEQQQTNIRSSRAMAGIPRTPTKNKNNQALSNVLDSCDDLPTLDYLHGIACNLHF